jgi:hypothetical protein
MEERTSEEREADAIDAGMGREMERRWQKRPERMIGDAPARSATGPAIIRLPRIADALER